jgi:signal transduction histidine kinase
MFLSIIPIVGVTGYAVQNRHKPGGRGLVLCLVGMIGWSLMLVFITWPTRVFPVHINVAGRFFFQSVVALGWPLFVWEYLQRDRVRLPPRVLVAVLVVPVAIIALAVTNPAHHLVVDAATPPNPTGISEFVLSPGYYVHIAFASILAMLPLGLLIADFRGAHGVHRQQLLLLMAGWVVGFPGALQTHLFRNIESIPPYVDLTPLSFLVTALLWGLALNRYQLFSLVPVSRRTAVETLADPVMTVGRSGVIVDTNPAARDVFGRDDDPVGDHVEELCRSHPELRPLLVDGEEPAEVTVSTDDEERQFVPQARTITRGDQQVGTLFVFRDVTRLRKREADLELLNEIFARVFRHNFRNRLNVIEGYAETIENRDADGVHTTEVEQIKDASQQLLSHSEKATVLRNLINDDQRQERNLSELVRTQVRRVDEETAATVETAIEDGVTVESHPLITTAIEELLGNAIEHHDGNSPPRLSVGVRSEAGEAILYVEDDGPGIDASELAALDRRAETALTHSTGVGLWVVDHIVRKSEGALSITDAVTLGGTRATIRFQRADS